jgi:hypothetical protein
MRVLRQRGRRPRLAWCAAESERCRLRRFASQAVMRPRPGSAAGGWADASSERVQEVGELVGLSIGQARLCSLQAAHSDHEAAAAGQPEAGRGRRPAVVAMLEAMATTAPASGSGRSARTTRAGGRGCRTADSHRPLAFRARPALRTQPRERASTRCRRCQRGRCSAGRRAASGRPRSRRLRWCGTARSIDRTGGTWAKAARRR